ncbi:MAG: SGNH/GDSL hydrolase family protein [Planctomycetota bacterium]
MMRLPARESSFATSMLLLAVFAIQGASAAAAEPQASRWEEKIAAFEAADQKSPPPKGAVLFLGSSTIVGWPLAKLFPDLPTINRGFGGSQISDSVEFAERIVLPHEPRVIVFYAGDNDLANGKTPDQVLADFKALVAKVHAAHPKTRILFVGIKPSLKRWALIDKIREANSLMRAYCASDDRMAFVDVERVMLGADGQPRKDLLKPDGLHLNDRGYEIWSDLIRPHLALLPGAE